MKRVLITGGSSGIGAALAIEFALSGYQVAIIGRNENGLEATKQGANSKFPIISKVADLTQDKDNEMVAAWIQKEWGGLDILINNAGISMRAHFDEMDLKVIREVMEVNFFGAVSITSACISMLLASEGTIVGISSVAGLRPLPLRTGYSASKAALQGFLESLRTEYLEKGLKVLVVYPGFTASDIRKRALNSRGESQGESPRNESQMMTAQQVAFATRKALEAGKNTLVLTREGKLTVLLQKFFPRLMDRIVLNYLKKEGATS